MNGSRGFYDLDLVRIERLDNPFEARRRARRPRDRNFVTFLHSDRTMGILPFRLFRQIYTYNDIHNVYNTNK